MVDTYCVMDIHWRYDNLTSQKCSYMYEIHVDHDKKLGLNSDGEKTRLTLILMSVRRHAIQKCQYHTHVSTS